jgi:hypothetical protein
MANHLPAMQTTPGQFPVLALATLQEKEQRKPERRQLEKKN